MDSLDITKKVASFIVAAGTGKIVTAIIQNNVEPEKIYQKVEIIAAGIVIGGMAKDATKTYTDAKIDEYATIYREHIKPRFQKKTVNA